MRVERALSQLLFKEVRLHLRADLMKRALENSYDYSVQKAFRAIDDWSYNYIDSSNLKRFLRSMGHIATKQELIAILRRFDMDGDAKINEAEFALGMKSSLSVYAKKGAARSKSGNFAKLVTTVSTTKLGGGANFAIRKIGAVNTQREQRRNGSKVRNQRPRTSKGVRGVQPSLQSYSGSLMPRDLSNN